MKTANDAVGEILCERHFNVMDLNHLIYAAATVITEEINGRKQYKLQTQILHTPPWIRRIQNTINNMRKELSQLVEIQRDNRKTMNKNKAKLFKKYNIETREGLAQLTEELKQKISAKTQRLAGYKNRQDQYYHNKLFKTDCKNFITVLGRHTAL